VSAKAGAGTLIEDIGREQAPQRGLRRIIAAIDPAPVPSLEHPLERRLEDVDVQAQGAVQLGELGVGHLALEAVVAYDLPDDGAVLLLHVALIVLAISTPPREGDLGPRTVLV